MWWSVHWLHGGWAFGFFVATAWQYYQQGFPMLGSDEIGILNITNCCHPHDRWKTMGCGCVLPLASM